MDIIYCPECWDMFERGFGVFLIVKPEKTFCSTKCLEAYHSVDVSKTFYSLEGANIS
jgi:hypothetical protein